MEKPDNQLVSDKMNMDTSPHVANMCCVHYMSFHQCPGSIVIMAK